MDIDKAKDDFDELDEDSDGQMTDDENKDEGDTDEEEGDGENDAQMEEEEDVEDGNQIEDEVEEEEDTDASEENDDGEEVDSEQKTPESQDPVCHSKSGYYILLLFKFTSMWPFIQLKIVLKQLHSNKHKINCVNVAKLINYGIHLISAVKQLNQRQ